MDKTITFDEFVETARMMGLSPVWAEANARGAIKGNHDLQIHIGPGDDTVVVTLASIKDYFERRDAPKAPPAEAPSPLLTDFMADSEVPPPPAAEMKKSDGKK